MQSSKGTPMIIALPTSFQMNCIDDTNHMASLFCYDCKKFSCVNCDSQIHDKDRKHNVKSIWDLYAKMIIMVCLKCKNANEIQEVLESNGIKQLGDDFVKNVEMVKVNVDTTKLPKLLKEMSDLYDKIFKETKYFWLLDKIKNFENKFSNIFNKDIERLKVDDDLVLTIKSIKDADKPPCTNVNDDVKTPVKKSIHGTAKVLNTKKVEVVQSLTNIEERVKIFDKAKQQSNTKSISIQPIDVRKAEEKKPEIKDSTCPSLESTTKTEMTDRFNEKEQEEEHKLSSNVSTVHEDQQKETQKQKLQEDITQNINNEDNSQTQTQTPIINNESISHENKDTCQTTKEITEQKTEETTKEEINKEEVTKEETNEEINKEGTNKETAPKEEQINNNTTNEEQTIPTSTQPEQSQAVQIMIAIPNTTSLLFFDSSNKTISECTFDTSIPLMKFHHAYINIYPHLYISGGLLPNIPQPSDSFIKITKTSSPDKPFTCDDLPRLSHPRSHHTMLYHPETNSIFALSGSCDPSCEVFSLDKNEWTLINDLKYARENATTLIHNKHIYVFFGFDREEGKYCTFIERLDISGNDFTEKEWEVVDSKIPLYLSRQMNMGYVLKEKSVMLFGGVNGMREYCNKVIEYDFDNDEGKEVKGLRLPIDCAYRQGGFIKGEGESYQCEKFYNFTTSFKIMECIQEKDVNIKINIY